MGDLGRAEQQSPKACRVRVEAPEGVDRLDIARALVGEEYLLKAEPKYGKRTFSRHKAMRELNRQVKATYEQTLDKMRRDILSYLQDGKKKLKKADDKTEQALLLLTPQQLEEVKQIIRDYHDAFAAGVLGPDVLPNDVLNRLTERGIVPEDLKTIFTPSAADKPPQAMRFIDTTYLYGNQLGQGLEQRRAMQKMNLDQVHSHIGEVNPTLSPVEKQAVEWARHSAGQHIRGMGDRVSLETGTVIMDADAEQRRRYLGVVREELEEGIDKRKEWRKLGSEIGHRTKDWSRDMQRLAATEQQWAMQEGNARALAKDRDPDDIRVAKQPNPDACPDCVRLHLTAGQGSKPRVFKLSELTANGTNVGKKRASWKAVVGPVHPWCGCELVEVPEGWGFSEEGELQPDVMLKKADRLEVGFAKSEMMTHRGAVPDDTVSVRISDPQMREVIEQVVAACPPEIFDSKVGVTLITNDIPRVQNPLEEHDFAYWTANEIRVMNTLPIERVPRVIRHELGHSLNVHLMNKLGNVEEVRKWHDKLWKVSKEEGWVSDYASKMPIENAAEVTRMYLFEKPQLMLHYPKQFAFVHRYYRDIFRRNKT